ncbi:MAG: sortase [Chloroflexi bacterium]|nr:sortase [Chloroflexota bacterium]
MRGKSFHRLRSISAAIGLGLMVLGIVTLLAVGALYAYGEYERFRFEQGLGNIPQLEVASDTQRAFADAGVDAVEQPEPPPPVIAPSEIAPSENEPTEHGEVVDLPEPTPTSPKPTPTPTPIPTPAPPAERIVISKIRVNSVITESKIENGEWRVPKFVAGHLEGTANPGESGNVVLSGHVESIASGNVFARLGELEPGDEITLFAGGKELPYQVSGKKVVENTDLSVIRPTKEETLTLITCTGTFNVVTRDYSHRLIIIATPSESTTQ